VKVDSASTASADMRRMISAAASAASRLPALALLTPALQPVLPGLLTHADRWNMVKLSAVPSGTPQAFLELAPGHRLAVMLSRCSGSSACLVNRHAAQRHVGGLLPMSLPYDHVFDQGWTFGLKVRLVTPTPCIHDEDVATTIAPGGASRKFAWWRRLPTHRYRLGNEWAPVIYGPREAWRERRR
jgi:glycosyl transferase family 25